MIDPDLAALWYAHVESTGRKVGGLYALTQKRVAGLGRLVEWAGGDCAVAEHGVRAIGASAWHRENNRDSLEDAPFRTREAFVKWAGDSRDPAAADCALSPSNVSYYLAQRVALEVLPIGHRVVFAGEQWDARLAGQPPEQYPILTHPTQGKSVCPMEELTAAAGDEAGMREAAGRLFGAVA